jgi:hypothetical protein
MTPRRDGARAPATRLARAPAWAAAVTAALLAACAQRGAPPGGPIDKDPPTIGAVTPAPGAVRVAPEDTVRLQFSESVDRKSVERGIRVFPNPGPIAFVWREHELTVELPPGAPVGYWGERVVTVLSSARDRRGNRLESTYEMAYTTRDTIPGGSIEGTVSGSGARDGRSTRWPRRTLSGKPLHRRRAPSVSGTSP